MKLETGLPIMVNTLLPIEPSIVRSVRHGLADVLEWLGEDVGPKPGDPCHAITAPNAIYVSKECFDELKRTAILTRRTNESSLI